MKNAKKVLAMVIVLALAISMAIPVSAAAGTITITGLKEEGVVYSAWKMADLSYADGAYTYTVAPGWEAYFETTEALAVYEVSTDGLNIVTKISEDASLVAAAAKKAVEYANTITATATATSAKVEGNIQAKINVTDAGYYCVDSTLGTICSINTYGDGSNNVDIADKNTTPVLSKLVDDAAAVDAYIDQEVTYTLTVTVADGAEGYKIIDTLPAGVTFKQGAENIKEFVTVEASNSAAVSADVNVVGQVVTFDIDGEDKVPTGGTITITYIATVNDSANIDDENTNIALLKYGQGSAFDANTASANVYTWSLDLVKYTGTVNNLLAGAKFEIYASNPSVNDDADPDNNVAPLHFNINGEGKYVYDKEAGTTEFTTNASTALTFVGLDQGTYYFKETAAPAGYNKLAAPHVVTITSSGDAELTPEYTTGTAARDNNDVQIENNTGAELPETGGTGTVIFIAVGSFLVLAMGVLLVVRKRMSKVVYTR